MIKGSRGRAALSLSLFLFFSTLSPLFLPLLLLLPLSIQYSLLFPPFLSPSCILALSSSFYSFVLFLSICSLLLSCFPFLFCFSYPPFSFTLTPLPTIAPLHLYPLLHYTRPPSGLFFLPPLLHPHSPFLSLTPHPAALTPRRPSEKRGGKGSRGMPSTAPAGSNSHAALIPGCCIQPKYLCESIIDSETN